MILPWTKVLGASLAGALIFSGYLYVTKSWVEGELSSAKEVIQRLEGWQGDMVSTIRLASGNDKVTKETALAQVQALGDSLSTLNGALKLSNDAVDRLSEETRRAEEAAAREAKARAAAILTAEKLRDELNLRAGSPVSADEMEAEVRRAQDAAYEAGL